MIFLHQSIIRVIKLFYTPLRSIYSYSQLFTKSQFGTLEGKGRHTAQLDLTYLNLMERLLCSLAQLPLYLFNVH